LSHNRCPNISPLGVNDERNLRWNLPTHVLGQSHPFTTERLKVGKVHLERSRMWHGGSNQRINPALNPSMRFTKRHRKR
jgi:hypothetical protein